MDIIRGILIIIVAVDHFGWTPSLFIQFMSDKSWLFASAAEGFFVISGMLVGYIYGPRLLTHTKQVIVRIWKRAVLLYGLAIGFTFFYATWSHILPNGYPRLTPPIQDAATLITHTLTLQYSYGWVDFLNRYAIFMLAAPFTLWLVVKGRWYIAAGISGVIWLTQQFYPVPQPFLAWQLLFNFGIIMGYFLPKAEGFIRSLPSARRKSLFNKIVISGIISYVGVVIWLYAIQFAHTISPPDFLWIFHDLNRLYLYLAPYLERPTLGIARILFGIVWFTALFCFVRRFEHQIEKATWGYLTLLGKNSLFVYILHGIIIFAVDSIVLPSQNSNILINTLLGVLFVSVLALATRCKDHLSKYSRKQQL